MESKKVFLVSTVMQFPSIDIIRENSVYNDIFSYLLKLFNSYLHISSYFTNY